MEFFNPLTRLNKLLDIPIPLPAPIKKGIKTGWIWINDKLDQVQQYTNKYQKTTDLVGRLAISVFLFLLNANLCAIGFAVGFCLANQVKVITQEVNNVYNSMINIKQKLAFIVSGGTLCFLTMPISLITATLYYSAGWGADLNERGREYFRKHDELESSYIV